MNNTDRLVKVYHRSADRHARRIDNNASDTMLDQALELSRRILRAIEKAS